MSIGVGELLDKLDASSGNVEFEGPTTPGTLGIDVLVEIAVGNRVQAEASLDFAVNRIIEGHDLLLFLQVELKEVLLSGGSSETSIPEFDGFVPQELSVTGFGDLGLDIVVGCLAQIVNVKDVKVTVSVRVHPELALWPDSVRVNDAGSGLGFGNCLSLGGRKGVHVRDGIAKNIGFIDAGTHQDVSLGVVFVLHVDAIIKGVGKGFSLVVLRNGGLDRARFWIDDRNPLRVQGPELTAGDVLVDLVSIENGVGWESRCCESQELGRSVHPRTSHGGE
mmetsp:Transcript_9623/g.23974  ORF Transcript_9623/g.23974 Transcript_9623/m.23974 type:complete len:278 (+) Transcript_9623:959-1792(+)